MFWAQKPALVSSHHDHLHVESHSLAVWSHYMVYIDVTEIQAMGFPYNVMKRKLNCQNDPLYQAAIVLKTCFRYLYPMWFPPVISEIETFLWIVTNWDCLEIKWNCIKQSSKQFQLLLMRLKLSLLSKLYLTTRPWQRISNCMH